MTIGVYTIDFHLPAARSLKDKRQVLRKLKDRLRTRHNVAVIESSEHANLWQRGRLTVVSVAESRDTLVRLFDSIERDTETSAPGQWFEGQCEFIEGQA